MGPDWQAIRTGAIPDRLVRDWSTAGVASPTSTGSVRLTLSHIEAPHRCRGRGRDPQGGPGPMSTADRSTPPLYAVVRVHSLSEPPLATEGAHASVEPGNSLEAVTDAVATIFDTVGPGQVGQRHRHDEYRPAPAEPGRGGRGRPPARRARPRGRGHSTVGHRAHDARVEEEARPGATPTAASSSG